MKQKKINNTLYVFDTTPYQITEDTDAEVIKVQEESVPGFKELNESLSDKIVKYNYKVVCITKQEWMDYINEPDPDPEPEPEKLSPELAWSAETATVTIGADDNVFPTLSNPHSLTILYGANNDEVATINDSTGEITLVGAGEVQIFANFLGDDTYEAQTIAYTLHVEAASQKLSPELAWSAEEATVTIGAADNVFPTLSNPHNLTILYGASHDEVATIDTSTGEITLVGPGDMQIYANFLGDDTYEAQTIAYTLHVVAPN